MKWGNHPEDRAVRLKLAAIVGLAAAMMLVIIASLGAEAIGHSEMTQAAAMRASQSACAAANDHTLPIQLQSELQAHCVSGW